MKTNNAHIFRTAVNSHSALLDQAPKAVTEAIAFARELDTLNANSKKNTDATHAAVMSIMKAVKAGKPIHDTPEVLALALWETAQPLLGKAAAQAWLDAQSTVHEHFGKIVSTWRDRFNTAAKQLEAAHQVIGNVKHSAQEAANAITAGGAAAEHWANIPRANKTIRGIAVAWRDFSPTVAIGANTFDRDHNLVIAKIDSPTATALSREVGPNPTAWDLVRYGCELDLAATPEKLRARITNLREERELEAAQAAEEARRSRAVGLMRVDPTRPRLTR